MRKFLTIVVLGAETAIVAIVLWQSDTPDATHELQVCEKLPHLEFDQVTDRWVLLATPIKTPIVCPIARTTGDLRIEGFRQPFVDTPLAEQMIKVDCYKNARLKSEALPTQMPDGLFCNVPVKIRKDRGKVEG